MYNGKVGEWLLCYPRMIFQFSPIFSSFDCYTPLERPGPATITTTAHPPEREDGECDTDSDSPVAAESSEDSDTNAPTTQRAILLPRRKRAPIPAPPKQQQQSTATRKKYDIWTEKIREDSLTETMRNFGVNRDGRDDRSIEWYDHTLGNRFGKDGKTNRLKRRRNSGNGSRSRGSVNGREEDEDDEEDGDNAMECSGGKRVCYNNRKPNRARLLEDLVAGEGASLEEFAKEVTEKLKESNEALIRKFIVDLSFYCAKSSLYSSSGDGTGQRLCTEYL